MLPVLAGPGRLNGGIIDIGAENLQRRLFITLIKELQETDGQGVDLFAGGAAGHPDTDGRIRGPILHQGREDRVLQFVEDVRVPEKGGDIDEDVGIQGGNLLGVVFEIGQIVGEDIDLAQSHAAEGAAPDSAVLIEGEVHPGGAFEEVENLAEDALLRRFQDFLGAGTDKRMPGEAGQLLSDAFGREDKVDAAGVYGTLGHTGVLGRAFILGEGEAPGLFDGLHTLDPVRGGAGEDDPDGLAALFCRQGGQEDVHRQVAALGHIPISQVQGPIPDFHHLPGGQDIDVIGLRLRAVQDFRHRQHGGLAEDLGQHAVLLGRQMLQQDKGHARVFGQVA